MKGIALILFGALVAMTLAPSSTSAQELLTNKSVVTLAEAGFNEDFIIDLISRGKTQFDTSVSGLAALAKQGISEHIIRVMLNPSAAKRSGADQDAVPATAPTDSSAKPTQLVLEPQRTALAIVGHATYSSRTSFFWGLWTRTLGVGPGPKNQDSPPHAAMSLRWCCASAMALIRIIPVILLAPQLAIGHGPIDIETEELPRAIQGVDYSAEIRATIDGRCPRSDLGLFLENGSLPPGLRITQQGLVGTPTKMGTFSFRIGAANNCAAVTREYQLLVTGRPILRAFPEELHLTIPAAHAPEIPPILISSSWPGLAYSLSAPGCPWLKLQPAAGTTPEEGSALTGDRVTVEIAADKLPPGVHPCPIAVSAWRANSLVIPVTVTVTPRQP